MKPIPFAAARVTKLRDRYIVLHDAFVWIGPWIIRLELSPERYVWDQPRSPVDQAARSVSAGTSTSSTVSRC